MPVCYDCLYGGTGIVCERNNLETKCLLQRLTVLSIKGIAETLVISVYCWRSWNGSWIYYWTAACLSELSGLTFVGCFGFCVKILNFTIDEKRQEVKQKVSFFMCVIPVVCRINQAISCMCISLDITMYQAVCYLLYVHYNYLFRPYILAIFKLYNKKLLVRYTYICRGCIGCRVWSCKCEIS
jgi:Na+-transporting NADH:ubiquinone oxidoreductase subunit NqrE